MINNKENFLIFMNKFLIYYYNLFFLHFIYDFIYFFIIFLIYIIYIL